VERSLNGCIQYNNCNRPARCVIESVARLRPLPPVSLDVISVSLGELRQTAGTPQTYCWSLVGTVPLSPKGRQEQRRQ
jgi:hypothetical protein